MRQEWRLGATYIPGGGANFEVWAPHCASVELHVTNPRKQLIKMSPDARGYFRARAKDLLPGTRYFYRLNGKEDRPDPASGFQPDGVHGASMVIEPKFAWEDQPWFGIPLRDYILYELHVGTFTPEGTFEAIIPHLNDLKELGVTAVELMPVAQFPGTRNWGYDGVYPFAVQNSYGGPEGLKRLVNAAHRTGLAVVLDVVYNHLGPEGNYLRDFGPYFTTAYKTPWGESLNYDGEGSDEVRRFFLENALYWQSEFHIDALRLDAVHAIRDFTAYPFLHELVQATQEEAEGLNRRFYLIAESDLNDPRLIQPEAVGGYGLDAQWADDFHHALHVLLTGEQDGYYADFGGVQQLAKIFREGYAYTGDYSRFRKRRHGRVPTLTSARQFVVYSQNHDQIGNRLLGERLTSLKNFELLKLAAGCVLLSPFIPMLFMGEEYGEPAPFQYMISHTDPELVEAVRKGRRAEFARFAWKGEPPDPFALETFRTCILDRGLCRKEKLHGTLNEFYQALLRLRKELSSIRYADKHSLQVFAREAERTLCVHYWSEAEEAMCLFCFAEQNVASDFDWPAGKWEKVLDSALQTWGGSGSALPEELNTNGSVELKLSPRSVAVFRKTVV